MVNEKMLIDYSLMGQWGAPLHREWEGAGTPTEVVYPYYLVIYLHTHTTVKDTSQLPVVP